MANWCLSGPTRASAVDTAKECVLALLDKATRGNSLSCAPSNTTVSSVILQGVDAISKQAGLSPQTAVWSTAPTFDLRRWDVWPDNLFQKPGKQIGDAFRAGRYSKQLSSPPTSSNKSPSPLLKGWLSYSRRPQHRDLAGSQSLAGRSCQEPYQDHPLTIR